MRTQITAHSTLRPGYHNDMLNGVKRFGVRSLQCGLEALVRSVQVKLHVSGLFWAQFFSSSHLIQSDEPLHDLAFIFKVSISDLVDRLYRIDENWMQSIFGQDIHAHSIEQGDEVFRSRYDGCGIRSPTGAVVASGV